MTTSETYDYLRQVRMVTFTIKRLEMQRESLLTCLLPKAIAYDDDRVQMSPEDKMTAVMVKVESLSRRIGALYERKADLVLEISEAIDKLGDGYDAIVLDSYYIGEMPMEKIADMIGYGIRRTYQFREAGVRKLGGII